MDTCVRMQLLLTVTIVTLLATVTYAVDKSNFKTCDQSGFCKRNRNIQPGHSPYYLELNSFKISSSKLEGVLVNSKNGVMFKLELLALLNNMVRMKITELSPMRPRFEAEASLVEPPKEGTLQVISQDAEKLVVKCGSNKVVLNGNPFRLDVYSGDQLVISANARGLMKFEHYRPKEQAKPAPEGEEQNEIQQQPPVPQEEEQFKDTLWEESFKGRSDSKPHGPSSVGMDFSFVGFNHVYGIPEHADAFPLRQTKGSMDPYRLYNLDVFEYELNSPMALYGSIPLMVAHSEFGTIGLLWLNAAETWVDIESSSNQGVVSSIVDFVKGSTPLPQQDTHWFSESGIIDVFFLLGPGPKDVMYQYAKLTGTTPLPPLFSFGYHQSRWNYRDQDDVRNVDAAFDEHDIPYDVLWLDLDHTHDRKYFTWDPFKFPNPAEMINNLTAKGRKMVTLVDPHIKRESNYFIDKEASDNDYYVKTKDNAVYQGWCWPGASGYLDFLNPVIRDWWSSKYALDQYKGSTLSLYTWNDMNEPSVFSEPEVTMPKDCKHYGGWEHRDIHNMYGMLMVMASYRGHLSRSNSQQRPFILARSVFAGSQRYGAVWTGDNSAEWSHLRISVPMVLSFSIAGMTFSGADVGGFFRNPDSNELLIRWYQAGSLQPFFRAHSHHETKRREPWLFDETTNRRIRDAIRLRYMYLPLWYTLFYENEFNGVPPMRPVWMEFPTEKPTFDMNDEYMIGDCLLVKPVLEASSTSINIYFPGSNQVWYDIFTFQKFEGQQTVTIPVTLDKIPVYQRGGTIIPRKDRIRRSASLTYNDPYTLVIALNKNGYANGSLYIDDFNSFQYRDGNHLLLQFTFDKNSLQSKIVGGPGKFVTKAWLEKVIIIGMSQPPKSVTVTSKNVHSKELLQTYNENTQVLTIRKPAVGMGEEWRIQLQL